MKRLLLILLSVMLFSVVGCNAKDGTKNKEVKNDVIESSSELVAEETTKPPKTEVPTKVPETPTPTEAPTKVPETSVPTQAPAEPPTKAPAQPEFVAYSPENVANIANDKVKAAGKILLPENMDRLLAEGKISQELYDEYYPYDGCGYYSVFVETNLLKASTISGRLLKSEEGIATHIAEMLITGTGSYVYVEYNGIMDYNGDDLYEFRCYR